VQFFLEKNLPNAIKNHPNGEISPNLVTLVSDAEGSFYYFDRRCEITTETPGFVTLERRKNITVVGKTSRLG
jgi:hypothetical protein